MPPIGRRPSSGEVDFGTGIYLFEGVHASGVSSEASEALATDVEDFTEAEEETLTPEEEDGALTLDAVFATLVLDFGATALDAGFDALEAIADYLGATALDAGADADETATDG